MIYTNATNYQSVLLNKLHIKINMDNIYAQIAQLIVKHAKPKIYLILIQFIAVNVMINTSYIMVYVNNKLKIMLFLLAKIVIIIQYYKISI